VQILGGIWADRFGGKVVLGFGVVWWSLATFLTPLAAKIGLPCLLTVRAFMGIGEVDVLYLSLHLRPVELVLFIPCYTGRSASMKRRSDDEKSILYDSC